MGLSDDVADARIFSSHSLAASLPLTLRSVELNCQSWPVRSLSPVFLAVGLDHRGARAWVRLGLG